MKSKILTLPISGGAGEVSPINQFQEDMENLLDAAENLLPDDLLDDSGVAGATAENWRRYENIVRGIFAARYTGWELPLVKYQAQPLTDRDCASVTITIPQNRPFTNKARTALAMAALLSDEITTTTDKGTAQICFAVHGIHAAATAAET